MEFPIRAETTTGEYSSIIRSGHRLRLSKVTSIRPPVNFPRDFKRFLYQAEYRVELLKLSITAAPLLMTLPRRLLRSTALFCIHWWRKTNFSLIIQKLYSVMKDTFMYDNLKSLGITNPEIVVTACGKSQ